MVIILAKVIFPLLREQFDIEKIKKSMEDEQVYDLPTEKPKKKTKTFPSVKYPNFNFPTMKSIFNFRNISISVGVLIV